MINVAKILSSPRLTAPFVILRRTATMTAGRQSVSEVEEKAVGSVQPAKGEILEKLPDGTALEDVVMVYTVSELRAAYPNGRIADGVVHAGRRYIVHAVPGAHRAYGFQAAVAIAESVTGAADA